MKRGTKRYVVLCLRRVSEKIPSEQKYSIPAPHSVELSAICRVSS